MGQLQLRRMGVGLVVCGVLVVLLGHAPWSVAVLAALPAQQATASPTLAPTSPRSLTTSPDHTATPTISMPAPVQEATATPTPDRPPLSDTDHALTEQALTAMAGLTSTPPMNLTTTTLPPRPTVTTVITPTETPVAAATETPVAAATETPVAAATETPVAAATPTFTPVPAVPPPPSGDDDGDNDDDDDEAPTAVPAGRVTGTVIDQTTRAPRSGIRVRVGDVVVETDEHGNYERTGLPDGTYEVELLLEEGTGTPLQGVEQAVVADESTALLHLFFQSDTSPTSTSLPAPEAPAATPLPQETQEPVPQPVSLPRTAADSGPGGAARALLVAGLLLTLMGGALFAASYRR